MNGTVSLRAGGCASACELAVFQPRWNLRSNVFGSALCLALCSRFHARLLLLIRPQIPSHSKKSEKHLLCNSLNAHMLKGPWAHSYILRLWICMQWMDVLCTEGFFCITACVFVLLYCDGTVVCLCVCGQERGPVRLCCVMPGSSVLCGTFGMQKKMLFFLFCSVLVFHTYVGE